MTESQTVITTCSSGFISDFSEVITEVAQNKHSTGTIICVQAETVRNDVPFEKYGITGHSKSDGGTLTLQMALEGLRLKSSKV